VHVNVYPYQRCWSRRTPSERLSLPARLCMERTGRQICRPVRWSGGANSRGATRRESRHPSKRLLSVGGFTRSEGRTQPKAEAHAPQFIATQRSSIGVKPLPGGGGAVGPLFQRLAVGPVVSHAPRRRDVANHAGTLGNQDSSKRGVSLKAFSGTFQWPRTGNRRRPCGCGSTCIAKSNRSTAEQMSRSAGGRCGSFPAAKRRPKSEARTRAA
jgi:hypothetical protein